MSFVCDDNVIMCGVRLVVDPPGRLFAEPSGGPPEALGGAGAHGRVKFCETTFGLNPLTDRDAASNGMSDCVDLTQTPRAAASLGGAR